MQLRTEQRAGVFVETEEPKRSCSGPTASFGDNGLGEKAKRGDGVYAPAKFELGDPGAAGRRSEEAIRENREVIFSCHLGLAPFYVVSRTELALGGDVVDFDSLLDLP